MYHHQWPDVTSAAFSPVADTMAVVVSWKSINGIILFDHDGAALKWLCKTTKRHYFKEPSFSPDGDKIAFVSNIDEENGNIYIMDNDGGNKRRLTSTADHDRRPVFSADGNKVYFIRYPKAGGYPNYAGSAGSHRGDVWVVDITTLTEKRVTASSFSRLYSLGTLPDGKHILIGAFITPRFVHVLWKINVDQLENITNFVPDLTPFATEPARRFLGEYEPSISVAFKGISLDGRYLVFPWSNPETKNADTLSQVYVTNMTNMKTNKIPNIGHSKSMPLAISADGQLILFKNHPKPTMPFGPTHPDSPLYIVNRNGSGLRNLTLDFTAIWPEVLQAQKIHERGW
jgi:tricorn protease-like protein